MTLRRTSLAPLCQQRSHMCTFSRAMVLLRPPAAARAAGSGGLRLGRPGSTSACAPPPLLAGSALRLRVLPGLQAARLWLALKNAGGMYIQYQYMYTKFNRVLI